MKLVYVAGPFSAPDRAGVERNIEAAVAVGLRVAALGHCPVVPHANTSHPDYERLQPYTFWIEATLALLRRCDAIVMVREWQQSTGARGERAWAAENGLRIFDTIEELEALG